MTFVSFEFFFFLMGVLFFYYIIPVRYRCYILLLGSLYFYYICSGELLVVLLLTSLLTYVFTRIIANQKSILFKKILLWVSIIVIILPLVITKYSGFICHIIKVKYEFNLAIPIGISFYTMQLIAYIVDVYKEKYNPEKNLFKFILFSSFFPQIIQGPIPRYNDLAEQLFKGHKFNEKNFSYGLQLILWGFFLKVMIADKSAIVVNTVFNNYCDYKGVYVLFAGILYSIQLYTDFLACVCIAQGVSELFSIKLSNNFNHPYFSKSIKEFWARWHISLSSWLKDYIYIPLGGNRKGKVRKYVNILIVFFVSGIWHFGDGHGFKYIFWGLLNGVYQVVGDVTKNTKSRIYVFINVIESSKIHQMFKQIVTFLLVTIAWIIFRAESLKAAFYMLTSMVTTFNPWVLFNNELLCLGLEWKDFVVLAISVLILIIVSYYQEKVCIRDKIANNNIVVRWFIYFATIFFIIIFGTYGFGYDANSFIYGGF